MRFGILDPFPFEVLGGAALAGGIVAACVTRRASSPA